MSAAQVISSLRQANYRLYFCGQLVSVMGTWMQTLAQSFLVLDLTHSGTQLGLSTAARFLPILVFGPMGGLFADRRDKRRILYVTQAASGVVAAVFALLTATHLIQIWSVDLLALSLGFVNVFDNPARQSFISEMVPRDLLPNAVTLNSVMVNIARVFGAAAGGVLVTAVGVAACFGLNAISFGAVLVSLAAMDPAALFPARPAKARKGQVREGLRYVRDTPLLLVPLLMIALAGTLAWEFQVTLPLMATRVFGGGPGAYGVMASVMGAGAVAGGLVSAARSRPRARALCVAAIGWGAVITAAALAPDMPLELACLALVGYGSITFNSYAKTTLQLAARPEMRGRVMALWAIAWQGSTPIGGPLVGWIAQEAGARWSLVAGGVPTLLCGLLALPVLAKIDKIDKSNTEDLLSRTPRTKRLPFDSPVRGGPRLGHMTTRTPVARRSAEPVSPALKWAPLAVILCGTFVYVLDFFVVNVALPDIQRSLHAGAAAVEWTVAGYGLSSAALLVAGGRLGDRYGRRRLFMAGIAIFTLTSALCAAAPDPAFLVAARIAQGCGGALMAPNVLSILGTAYTGPDRVRAISVYGMVMGLAAVAGQLIGGLLISADIAHLGWRAVFWVNVPVGIAALLAAPRLVPESRAGDGTRLDLTGAGLLTAALTAIVLPLLDGRQDGWPAWSWACLIAGVALLALFAGHLRRAQRRWTLGRGGRPLLDPGIFAVRAFRSGLTCQVLFWCQQAASYLLLALYLQQGRGLSPLASGGVFSVLAAGYLLTSLRAPAMTVRFGRRVVAAGALTGAAGDLLLALAAWRWGALWAAFPGLFLLGAGQGLCITPLTTTVLSHADARTAGSVSGALATAQQVGNAIGVAVSGIVFYGLLTRGFGVAYGWSTAEMAALLLGVVALTFLIPRVSAPNQAG